MAIKAIHHIAIICTDYEVSKRFYTEFPDTPPRLSRPEASGLRHLAFAVDNIESEIDALAKKGIQIEDVRIDEITGKKFTFFTDPDNLPLEFYEI